MFDNIAGKHERVGLESKLQHDASNSGQLIKSSKNKGRMILEIGARDMKKRGYLHEIVIVTNL